LIHKVTCAVCSKKSKVEINDKTRKIMTKYWFYYHKININYQKADRYFYTIPRDKKGKLLFMDPNKWIKIENPKYDKNAKPKLVEHWECLKCSKED
jgi:hypothetical protein